MAFTIWLALGNAACGEPPPIPESTETPEMAAARAGAPTAARYLTTYAFASAGGDVALYAAFSNETGGPGLLRDYTAWLSREASWARLLRVRDTIPVPRAGWRLLPTDSLGVFVGDGAQVVGLRFLAGEDDAYLRMGEEIAAWTGATGQVQALYLAGLETRGDLSAGFVFFHRAARPLGSPAAPTADRVFLLADTLGNGLLIEASVDADEPAVARTWLHGTPGSWSDVTLEPAYSDSGDASPARRSGGASAGAAASPASAAADSSPPPTAWLFVIPQADLSGELRITPEEEVPGPTSLTARRAVRISGELVADGESFRFHGLTVELPLP